VVVVDHWITCAFHPCVLQMDEYFM